MARSNKTECAVLGLLAMGPLSGYDIKTQVERTLSHFWSESIGNIYPTLSRMQERGWVSSVKEAHEKRPARKVYSITAQGRASFDDWMRSEITSPKPRNEVLLRVYFGRFLPPAELAELLEAYREKLTDTLNRLMEITTRVNAEHQSNPDKLYYDLTLDFGVRVFRTLIDWSNDAETILKDRVSPGRKAKPAESDSKR